MAATLIFLVSLCTVLQQIQACPCDKQETTCDCKGINMEILDKEIGSKFTTLDFENTNLKKVKAGVFNKAEKLKNIKLNGTKLVCDCDIMYLRSWLMKVSAKEYIFQARCSSPPILKNRLIAFLSNSEIECKGFCSWVIVSQSVLYAFLSVHGIIIMALVHYVRRKEKVDKNLYMDFRTEDPYSVTQSTHTQGTGDYQVFRANDRATYDELNLQPGKDAGGPVITKRGSGK